MDFVVTPLERPTRSDLHLPSQDWTSSVAGACHTTSMDLTWAFHMKLPAVILPEPDDNLVLYAQCAHRRAIEAYENSCQLWVPIPLTQDGFQRWQTIYTLCNYHSNLGVLLCLDPSTLQTNWKDAFHLLHCFLGLSVRAVLFDCSRHFLTNSKGYPVLSKSTQLIFEELLRRIGRSLRVLIKGPGTHDVPLGETTTHPYVAYLRYFRGNRPSVCEAIDSDDAKLESNYLDTLQSPLQPLKDHLEFNTYETFEKDPVKYWQYEKAISLALHDRQESPSCTLIVLGAGRGPLMDCALRAYSDLDPTERPRELHAIAVEKNPAAIVYLRSLVQYRPEWKNVTVVESDIRSLSLDQVDGKQADIVVSELLGSFGCNELSPECLDGFFETQVASTSTISIPHRYISHVAPLSSAKLLNEVRSRAFYPTPHMTGMLGEQIAFETPYVVRTHSASQTHTAQDCWEFVHPNPYSNNNRHVHLEFDSRINSLNGSGYPQSNDRAPTTDFSSSWTLTGLLATFSAELYTSSKNPDSSSWISIEPTRFSRGMFSWFPLYFPLSHAIVVPENGKVHVDIWRLTNSAKVWYEWSVSIYDATSHRLISSSCIHNPGGRSYSVETTSSSS